MKGLVIKTILIVSAVALTGILAWAAEETDSGTVAPNSDPAAVSDGISGPSTGMTEAHVSCPAIYGSCTKCCDEYKRRAVEARLGDNTAATPSLQKSDGQPAKQKTNVEGE